MTKNDTKNGKVYFARFTDKETKQVFYKFGHTRSYDAMDRFTYEPEQYAKWDIKIMCTVYGPLDEMIGIEEALKAIYPDRKSTRLNSSHSQQSRMPSSA